jgi:hypothetical protein
VAGGAAIGTCRNHGSAPNMANIAYAQRSAAARQVSPSARGAGGSPAAASIISIASSSLLAT